jgi:hypothetical protein
MCVGMTPDRFQTGQLVVIDPYISRNYKIGIYIRRDIRISPLFTEHSIPIIYSMNIVLIDEKIEEYLDYMLTELDNKE